LRLKVYSLKMCRRVSAYASTVQHAHIQRPTVSDSFQNHLQRDRHLRWLSFD
jgi:hypothetical protein